MTGYHAAKFFFVKLWCYQPRQLAYVAAQYAIAAQHQPTGAYR